MLITQPSIMWIHGGIFGRVSDACYWFSVLFPRFFASGMLLWAEYASVSELYRHFGATAPFFVLSSVISGLFLLCLYTYIMVIHVGAGSPQDYPELRKSVRNSENPYSDNMETDANTENGAEMGSDSSPLNNRSQYPPQEFLTSHTLRNNEPAYRWCSSCEVWKPDRCHHCSTCRKCYLRMDHHCPWFSCCIGYNNHKYFVQVLLYITSFSTAVCAVSTWLLYSFFANEQYLQNTYLSLNLVFLFVISLAFVCAVGCFAGFSVYMVLKNYTTIEFQDEKWSHSSDRTAEYEYDENGKKRPLGHLYDLGMARNWQAIMGRTWLEWIFPISVIDTSSVFSKSNGLNFEVHEQVFQKYCYNAQLQEQLNAQLAEYRDRIKGK
ncbi:hypothetical protein OXX69_006970 [Metschnikowia pulcherrima]